MSIQWRSALWFICQWNLIIFKFMSKTAFAKTIIAKLNSSIGTNGGSYTSGSASSAMEAVAAGITEYLIANTKVEISYSGIVASTVPYPDPIIMDSFKIIGKCTPASPSNGFDNWIKQIEANIIAGFQLASMGNAGIVFSQKPFLNPGIVTNQSNLKVAHDIADESPQQKVWEVVCEGIMNWINGIAKNNMPGSASRPTAPSTGTASIIKITLT